MSRGQISGIEVNRLINQSIDYRDSLWEIVTERRLCRFNSFIWDQMDVCNQRLFRQSRIESLIDSLKKVVQRCRRCRSSRHRRWNMYRRSRGSQSCRRRWRNMNRTVSSIKRISKRIITIVTHSARKMTSTNTNEESGWFEFLEPWQRK